MGADNIWLRLKACGFTDAGAAGAMGNIQAESALISINLQNTGNNSLGMTDAEYTNAVDIGSYTNFVYDSIGYGLCQWTFWSRKKALLDYKKSKGTSIGDEDMQIDFFVKELKDNYSSVYKTLTTTDSVREASNAMLLQYERPANQSIENQNRRAEMSQKWYDKYHTEKEEEIMGTVLHEYQADGYNCKIVLVKEPIEVKPTTTTIVYTVKSGDTLSAIAKQYNTTVDAIVAENKGKYPNITRDYIRAGWQLPITTTN